MSDPDAPIVVSPGQVSLDDFARVLAGAVVVIDPSFWPRVEAASVIVAKAARSDVPVYGINTGFGKLASKRIQPDQTTQLQRNLIVSHCCGVGPPTPEPIVRLMMALKIVSLGRGASGVRREIIEQLQAMLARGICPLVPQQGSVGASGDLAPLAHMYEIGRAPESELHPDHGLAQDLARGFWASLPYLDSTLIASILGRGRQIENHHDLAALVGSEQFRAALGRIACGYDGGQIIEE